MPINECNHLIHLENVSYAYQNEDVLQDVDLVVDPGTFLAVIGPNGGGKTTLVRLLLGLIEPRKGEIRVLGTEPAKAAGRIGYVPQYAAFAPSFPISVLDVALLGVNRGRRYMFGPPPALREAALAALDKVAMADFATRRFDNLSGGQRQRVLVARALMAEPELMLFDEPTSNIDPRGKSCLFDLLAELSRDISVVLISHDLVSASVGFTGVAVVNRRLIQGTTITHEMLELLYGAHDPTCPMDGYLRTLGSMFDDRSIPGLAHVHEHLHGHGHSHDKGGGDHA